jgi:glycosyltransferase involved in cell wall biosynthesis
MSEVHMKLSIILPCYKEAANLPAMLAALTRVLDDVSGDKEIIAVDDGSPDETWKVLLGLKALYKDLHIVRFARNFGKEAALTCGLRLARGDIAITMDADLQHPPEVIPEMLERWRQGARVVYALRRDRETDGLLREFLSRSFYFVFHQIAELDLPHGAGDFRLLDRKAIDAINLLPEKNRFMKGLMTWVGFEPGYVHFDVHERPGGKSSFRFRRLFSLALDAITSFSVVPLRVWSFIGAIVSLSAFLYFIYLVISTLIFGVDTPGFATIMCMMLFLGGVQLIGLGVIGEYVGRIFSEVKNRPVYIVADDLPAEGKGFGPPPASIIGK